LIIAADNSWFVSYNNLSSMPDWFSDGLCRLSTGAGFSTRALYTDREESLFAATRPVFINSIEDLIDRGDALERTVTIRLPIILASQRRTDRELDAEFVRLAPSILGALLDGLSTALRRLPDITVNELPRMADTIKRAEAAAPAFGWKDGEFTEAYLENLMAGNAQALENELAEAILRLDLPYEGIATQLLRHVNARVDEKITKEKGWPKDGRGLSGKLRRLAPALRANGVLVVFPDEKARPRLIKISFFRPPPEACKTSSSSSERRDEGKNRGNAEFFSPTMAENCSVGPSATSSAGATVVDGVYQEPPKEHAGGGASVPFVITRAMRSKLHDLGYTDGAIAQMTPQGAHAILDGKLDAEPTMADDEASEHGREKSLKNRNFSKVPTLPTLATLICRPPATARKKEISIAKRKMPISRTKPSATPPSDGRRT